MENNREKNDIKKKENKIKDDLNQVKEENNTEKEVKDKKENNTEKEVKDKKENKTEKEFKDKKENNKEEKINTQKSSNKEEKKSKMNPKLKNILEWVYCVIIAIVLALAFRYYIGTPTIVQQPSMNYTLEEGQRLILSRWTRTINGKYNRGDIITFEAPKVQLSSFEINQNNPVAIYDYEPKGLIKKIFYYVVEIDKTSFIKRVIGIAGDHIKIMDGKVYLNGEELKEDYLGEGVTTIPVNYSDIIVPEGYVFVMGDNRAHSTDSRAFGCIPLEKIESKVVLRFWPLNKFGKIK